jgi:desulfoferrodoxin (superoxide reductase-like protein)
MFIWEENKNFKEIIQMKKFVLIIICFLFLFCLSSKTAFANKSAITLEGPTSAVKGSEVTFKITVTHSGNSFFHYTKLLKVQANGQPVQQWDYTAGNRPEGETFTKEITIKVLENTEVVAEASCNVHGSAGPAKLMIQVK